MKILIDNTSLHSAGNMIINNQAKLIDVDSLIQLCLQIIFSEKIYLTGLDLDEILNRSSKIIQKLESIGVEKELITFGNYDIETLVKGCKKASIISAEDIRILGLPKETDLSAFGPLLPSDYLERETKFIDIVKNDSDLSQLEELKNFHISRKANGAVDFMIAESVELRDSFKYLLTRYNDVSHNQLYQLTSFIRARLNQSIANSKNLVYSPSITRAGVIRMGMNFIINELSKSVDESVEEVFEIGKLEIPTLHKYLVIQSKGIPEKMIETAIEVREKSDKLRKWLSKLVNSEKELASTEKHMIAQNMKKLKEDLKSDLDFSSNRDKAVDAFDFSPILTNPMEILNVKKFFKWLRYNSVKDRLAILTEISLETIYHRELIAQKNNLLDYVKYKK